MNQYRDIPILSSTTNKRYYGTTKYPEIPLDLNDVYVYSTIGDRLD
jgi:hypothetical protein